ncbi:MAG TPA: ATP-binding protein [Synergistales bacterium]|nr:ATP-binding protein [Synergistales bacterium]
MRERKLFLRIFLWFLGAMLLMALVSVLLTVFMTQQGIILTGQQEALSNALDRNGKRLLELHETETPSRLSEEIERIRNETGLAIFIFDGRGTPVPIEGGPSGEFLVRLGKDALNLLDQGTTFQTRGQFSSVFRRLVSPSGKDYILVGSFRRSPYIARVLTGNPKALAIHLLGLLVTALVFCFLLARYLADPLVRLSRTARSVSGGRLDTPVDDGVKKRSDEIGELARSFEAMTRHLTTLLEAQRRLIQDISHELRTPLARLGVALELAQKKSGAVAKESLDRIGRESEVLNVMIGDLLSLSRLEAEMEHMDYEKADLGSILESVVEDANFEARAMKRKVELVYPDDLGLVRLYSELVRRAVENIVRNGLRYAPEGTSVIVRAELLDRDGRPGVSISVRDRGPGVPEAELEEIFKPFYRTESSRSRDTGGTGLGLAIARKAALAHGGDIRAVLPPGGGLLVEMWLPIHPQGRV